MNDNSHSRNHSSKSLLPTLFSVWLLVVLIVSSNTTNTVSGAGKDSKTGKAGKATASPTKTKPAKTGKQIQEWMGAEKEFQKMDELLEIALGDDFLKFRAFMDGRIKEHHSKAMQCYPQSKYSDEMAKSTSYDECSGKGSLTESELILHEALDEFKDKFRGKDELVKFHQLAHETFGKTRKLLQDMSLLQSSEYDPDVLEKHHEMVAKYNKRSDLK